MGKDVGKFESFLRKKEGWVETVKLIDSKGQKRK